MSETRVYKMEDLPDIEAACKVVGMLTTRDKTFDRTVRECITVITRLIATVRTKETALAELAGIYDVQYGAYNQLLLDALTGMSGAIDAFVRDCKKHHLKIPHDVFHGSYQELQNKYHTAQNLLREQTSSNNEQKA